MRQRGIPIGWPGWLWARQGSGSRIGLGGLPGLGALTASHAGVAESTKLDSGSPPLARPSGRAPKSPRIGNPPLTQAHEKARNELKIAAGPSSSVPAVRAHAPPERLQCWP